MRNFCIAGFTGNQMNALTAVEIEFYIKYGNPELHQHLKNTLTRVSTKKDETEDTSVKTVSPSQTSALKGWRGKRLSNNRRFYEQIDAD